MKVFIALIHYPVYNKEKEVISTQITNLDLHDISRLAKTYSVEKFFIVSPFESQRELARKIMKHWTEGYGAGYNEFRKEAFDNTAVAPRLEEVIDVIEKEDKERPRLIATAAGSHDNQIDYQTMKKILQKKDGSYLFLFGTGWGLVEDLILKSDYVLEPIRGNSDYNHLSVRSAVAIILDRLLGERNIL